jgi:hypothetical protein
VLLLEFVSELLYCYTQSQPRHCVSMQLPAAGKHACTWQLQHPYRSVTRCMCSRVRCSHVSCYEGEFYARHWSVPPLPEHLNMGMTTTQQHQVLQLSGNMGKAPFCLV